MAKQPQNPWRKGVAAGNAYHEAFAAYVAALKSDQPLPRPERPKNPYPMPTTRSKNAGARQWEAGLRYADQQADQRRRCGGRAPSFKFASERN